jgi:hypothetical protein
MDASILPWLCRASALGFDYDICHGSSGRTVMNSIHLWILSVFNLASLPWSCRPSVGVVYSRYDKFWLSSFVVPSPLLTFLQ